MTGQALSKLVNSYQLGNVSFAFELGEAGGALEPSTLLLTGELPVFPQLTVSNPLSDSESLLTALLRASRCRRAAVQKSVRFCRTHIL